MSDLIKQVVDKISSYTFFNNLFPGIVFCYLLDAVEGINIFMDSILKNLVLFYFVGMVLSRVASVILDPILKQIKIGKHHLLRFSSYSNYKKASKDDPLIVTLSEVNNMYRNFISCFLCFLVYKASKSISGFLLLDKKIKVWFILIAFILLFIASYSKQTAYISKRIDSVIRDT